MGARPGGAPTRSPDARLAGLPAPPKACPPGPAKASSDTGTGEELHDEVPQGERMIGECTCAGGGFLRAGGPPTRAGG